MVERKWKGRRVRRRACLSAAVVGATFLWSGALWSSEEPPEGVEQLLERGAIPAVFDPTFVPAAEADLPEDAWVLGVVVEGQSRAYSLNLLNAHEVVNDEVGGKAFAAVW